MKQAVLIVALDLLVIPCIARTITVDDDGPADFNSIQSAVDDADNNDTITIAPGTYYENIRIRWKEGIILEGGGADVTTIDGGENGHVVSFNLGSGMISGFTITNSGIYPMYSAGVFTSQSEVIVVNNIITNSANGVVISSNSVVTVAGNVISSNRGTPFSTSVDIPTGSYALISGNLIVGGEWGIWSLSKYSEVYVVNNTIADHELYGILCTPSVRLIQNNIIVGNKIGISLQGGLESPVPLVEISYNNVWNNWLYDYLAEWSGDCSSGWCTGGGSEPFEPQPGTGEMSVDPLFADSGGGDYHLLPDSPCIDAGDNNGVPPDVADLDGDGDTNEPVPFDLDGNSRMVDGNSDGNAVVDMGAYEYLPLPVECPMHFTPRLLNPKSKGKWVKAHFVLPEGYAVEDVGGNRPCKITEPFEPDIESAYMNVFVNNDGFVKIEAAFERRAFCQAGISGETVEVRVEGKFISGQGFFGTDTIRVVDNTMRDLATLVSYWLDTGCNNPDWCEGADINQDSVIDLADFALLDGCCVQIVGE